MATTKDIFESLLPSRIQNDPEFEVPANGPTPTRKLNILINGEVDTSNEWIVDFTAPAGERVTAGRMSNPNFQIEAAPNTLEQLWDGDISLENAYLQRDFDVSGNMRLGLFFYSAYFSPQETS